MWEHHHVDLPLQQIRNDGMERISYSLGVYPDECNQAKTSPHVVVQPKLACPITFEAGRDDFRKVECPDFWSSDRTGVTRDRDGGPRSCALLLDQVDAATELIIRSLGSRDQPMKWGLIP